MRNSSAIARSGPGRTLANTLKYISITTSANYGNMLSMALAMPFLPFLPLLAYILTAEPAKRWYHGTK